LILQNIFHDENLGGAVEGGYSVKQPKAEQKIINGLEIRSVVLIEALSSADVLGFYGKDLDHFLGFYT
jgi:hypothetical protein